MLRKFPPIYFWVTTVALSIAAGLFWLGALRHVVGEVDLLFLPKTDRAVVAPANAAILMQSPHFRSRLDELQAKEFPRTNEKDTPPALEVVGTVLEGSSVLRMEVSGSEQSTVKTAINLATKELLQRLSQYYNFQTELDVRIIDGPRFAVGVVSWPLLFLVSIMTGFGVSVLFFLMLASLERLTSHPLTHPTVDHTPHITPDTFRPQVVTPYWSRTEADSLPVSEKEQTPGEVSIDESYLAPAEEVYRYADPNPADVLMGLPDETFAADRDEDLLVGDEVIAAEAATPAVNSEDIAPVSRAMATGPAPDNLPISDLSPLEAATARLYKADIDATAEAMATDAEDTLVQQAYASPDDSQMTEPTQEDYKRRLNELLSGKL